MTRRPGSLICTVIAGCAALALAAAPAAAGEVIYGGVDGWRTASSTYSTFAHDPIPADFFCPGSKPFTGRIDLRGVPIATEPAGALDGQDTLVGRLDDAPFDREGVARTRIALIALNLESVEPIETECGRFDVRVVLDDEQPTTEMSIVRRAEGGGTFEAPLALNTRVIFTPVAGGESRELARRVDLGPGSNSVWIEVERPSEARMVRVDSDGDGVADHELALRSNFRAGVAPVATACRTSCHCTEGSTNPNEPNEGCEHLHCVYVNCPNLPAPTPTPSL